MAVSPEENTKVQHIGTQTYVSVGLIILILSGFGLVLKGINDNKVETVTTKNELSTTALNTKNELSNQIGALNARITNMETSRNSWTSTDMFKWAVHLQQANPQIKVPEPEVNNK